MTTAALLGGRVQWDHALDAIVNSVAVLRRDLPAGPGRAQSALLRDCGDLHAAAAARFARRNGWRWRPERDFSLAMLAGGRARRRWQGDPCSFRYDLDHPDYYWSPNGRRPAALVVHNYGDSPPEVGPYLRQARTVYGAVSPALAVLRLPRSWYLPTGTTAFLVVPAAPLRAAT